MQQLLQQVTLADTAGTFNQLIPVTSLIQLHTQVSFATMFNTSGTHPASYLLDNGSLFLGPKQPEHEDDHLTPRSSSPSPLYTFMA